MTTYVTLQDILIGFLSGDVAASYSAMHVFLGENFWYSIFWLCSLYILLQTFAIPGPALLGVLMAALFGGWVGGLMSMSCSLIGSSFCYYIFKRIGSPILGRFCKKRLSSFKRKVTANKDNLFFYFLFLRVTPIVPNWFLNIASGNIGISFSIFLFGSMIGLIPNAIILATAGIELAKFGQTGLNTGFDAKRALSLLAIGLLTLLPILIKKLVSRKFGK